MFFIEKQFLKHIKRNDIYKDIAEDVESKFVTSNYELDRPLPIGKSKKVIGLIKDELEVKISWIKKENF